MPEETEKDVLKKIFEMLTEIRSILALSNEDKLSQAKKRLLPENSVKLQVYNLCDGTKTTQEIATAIQKTEGNARAVLSVLRNEGLVRAIERDGKQFYEQIF